LLPEWQGQGIGSSVLRSLVDRGAESRRAVTLQVLHCNPRALELYGSFGFRRSGRSVTHVLMRLDPRIKRDIPTD
jgi:ribosomal protein S18 acetylase RimI-like enzyme